MNKEEFVKELFELCRKHKENCVVTTDDGYEINITGAWDINKENDAVEIYKKEETFVGALKGTKNASCDRKR